MTPITDSGQSQAQGVLAVNVLFVVLPLPFVAMRLWSRRLTRAKLALNDYLILVALILSITFGVTIMIGVMKGGVGQHIANLSTNELAVHHKIAFAATLLWPSSITFVKLSVLHFYSTMFSTKKTVTAAYTVAALTLTFWLGTMATAFGICVPLEYNWNKNIVGRCGGDRWTWYLSTAVINLVLDVIIIILPLPCLWQLQMRTSQKVSLATMFGLGGVICIVSILRCASLWTYQTADFTYDEVLNVVTSTLEPTLGVILACLPTLQPVLSRVSHSAVITRISRGSGKIRSGLKRDAEWARLKKLSGVRFSFQMHGLKAHESPVVIEVATMNDGHSHSDSVVGQAV